MNQKTMRPQVKTGNRHSPEELYRAIFEQAAEGIFLADVHGCFIEVNRQGCQLLGYSLEELLKSSWSDLIPLENPTVNLLSSPDLQVGKTLLLESQLRCQDGHLLPVEIRAQRLSDSHLLTFVCDITERQQAQAVLQEQLKLQDQLTRLTETAPGALCTFRLHPNGVTSLPYVSPAWEDLYNLSQQDVETDASPIFRLIHPDDLDHVFQTIQASARTLRPWRAEFRILNPEKGLIWVEGHSKPILELDGSILWHGFITDITERKRANDALAEERYHLRTLIDNLPDLIFLKDTHSRFVVANQATAKFMGAPSPEALLGKSDFDFYPPDLAAEYYDFEQQIIRSGKGVTGWEKPQLDVNGNQHWLLTIKLPLQDQNGQVIGLVGIEREITDQKRVAIALRDSEEFNRAVLNSILSHVAVLDRTGVIVAVNEAWRRFASENSLTTGQLPAHTDVGADYLGVVKASSGKFSEEAQIVYEGIRAVLEGKRKSFTLEYPCHSPTEERWFLMNVTPLSSKQGGAVVSHLNITARQQAEIALRQSEQMLERAQAMAHVGSWTADLQTGTFTGSAEGSRLVGWSPGIHRAEELFDVVHPDDLQRMQDTWQAAMTGAPYDIEHRVILNGQIRWLHIKTEIEFDGDGRPVKATGVTQDITERKQAEQEIWQLNETLEQRVAERTTQLAAANKELEAFAYSVSHDLRAPLRAIDGYTRILVEDYESFLDAEGRRVCGIIQSETERMGRLIDDLLTFSRLNRAPLRASTINMSELAALVFETLTTATDHTRIDFKIEPLPLALGDPALIQQVWINLLSNALKFSSKKEQAVINVSGQQCENEVIYAVHDNGAGFEMEYADKLFGVFQRLHTEAEFPGTGVGLAIVQRIIHRHDGRVWAESELDQSASFYFTLSCPSTGASS